MLNSVVPSVRSGFDDSFLASPTEIIAVLVDLTRRRSSRPQASRVPFEAGLSRQHSTIIPTHGVALRETNLPIDAAVETRQPIAPVQSHDERPSGRRRKYCKCGQCRWCLDNARWDRIFSEKYADSSYYTLKLSHNSSLARAR